jgi:steroid delta-isomerase-like uncharacterized protein
MSDRTKNVVRRLYDELLNGNRLDVADQIATEDFAIHFAPNPATGPEALKATARMLHSGFPDLHFSIDDLVAEGDRVAVRWTMTGTHTGTYFGIPASGRSVELRAIVIFRLVDDRLAELWPLIDIYGLRQQIGAAEVAA